jgi:hypothetical protein
MELDQGTASTSPVKPAQQQGDDPSGNNNQSEEIPQRMKAHHDNA